MTLRLILTRHAKSDWAGQDISDHDRPLSARGRRSARAIGHWLAERDHVPDAALLSTARRVRETWEELLPGFDRTVPATWDEDLYLSSPEQMLDALSSQSAASVTLIAHNPGMASLARWLARDPPQRVEFDRFPTCATLILDFDEPDWSAIGPLSGRLVDFVVPRDLSG